MEIKSFVDLITMIGVPSALLIFVLFQQERAKIRQENYQKEIDERFERMSNNANTAMNNMAVSMQNLSENIENVMKGVDKNGK